MTGLVGWALVGWALVSWAGNPHSDSWRLAQVLTSDRVEEPVGLFRRGMRKRVQPITSRCSLTGVKSAIGGGAIPGLAETEPNRSASAVRGVGLAL